MLHWQSATVVVWERKWPAQAKKREEPFVRFLPCARPLQIFSYVILETTLQVDNENPILQMSKLCGINISTVFPPNSCQRDAKNIRMM